MNTFTQLNAFIDSSFKEGRYSKNVAHSVGTALRVLKPYLNKEQMHSVDAIKTGISEITQKALLDAKSSPSSVMTYRSRILRLLADYESVEGQRFSKGIPRSKLRNRKIIGTSPIIRTEAHRIELALRPGQPFTLIIPRDITRHEAQIMKSVLDSVSKS